MESYRPPWEDILSAFVGDVPVRATLLPWPLYLVDVS